MRSTFKKVIVSSALAAALIAGGFVGGGPAAAADVTVSGTITGAAGDQEFSLTFVPLTGAGESLNFQTMLPTFSVSVPSGRYHLLVTSVSGESAAGWYGGASLEADSDTVTVPPGGLSGLAITLGTSPGTIHGMLTQSGVSTMDLVRIEAFARDLNGGSFRSDREVLATDTAVVGTAYELHGLPAGTYWIRATDIGSTALKGVSEIVADLPVGGDIPLDLNMTGGPRPTIVRLAGADRYATATLLADRIGGPPFTVFIVNGENFPDALSAAPVAAGGGGAILLVTPTKIPDVVKHWLDTKIDRVSKIIVIGGTSSVSTAVYAQLAAYHTHTNQIERISGGDRYATSRAVFAKFGEFARTIYLASGQAFPDALAAGAAASVQAGGVLLVDGRKAIDEPTKVAVGEFALPLQIAGGTSAVSTTFEKSVAALGFDDLRRRAGVDRFDTSARISDATFGWMDTVFLATGANFPDALAGSAVAGIAQAPVMLVRKDCVPAPVAAELQRLKPERIFLLGGPAVISDAMVSLPTCTS